MDEKIKKDDIPDNDVLLPAPPPDDDLEGQGDG